MVQVCSGGGGGKEWKGMEGNGILSLEGSKEGPLRGRLADRLEGLMGELRVPGVGRTTRE